MTRGYVHLYASTIPIRYCLSEEVGFDPLSDP
jgi:hypothetical protein